MTSEPENDLQRRRGGVPDADSAVAWLKTLQGKVDDMRTQRSQDAESLGDKMLTMLVPAAAAFVAGKVFSAWWNRKGPSKGADASSEPDEAGEGLIMGLVFSALSAAFVAVVSQLSGRGSRAFVNHRHRRATRRGSSSAR